MTFSGLGVLAAGWAGCYIIGTTIQSLRMELAHQKELMEQTVQEEALRREAAVAQAEKAVMEKFLQLGFTEEYQRYQQRTGQHKPDDDGFDGP